MPKQYVVFGRPVPRLGTRHTSVLLVIISLFAVFSLLFTLPSAIPTGPSLALADHRFSIPSSLKNPWYSSLNPFKQPSHAPPRQRNDTYDETSWYSNFKWLSIPFSSSVTFDENRLLLPMLVERPPIYCYYDNTVKREPAIKDAESDLLLSWRRAWWAQGFKPIILSQAEAMNNPRYEELQRHEDMNPKLKTDIMRWLAWENMGGGLLAHHLLLPMGSHTDPLLSYLRRGEFPKLTRWKDLDDGLFVGPKADIATVIKLTMASPNTTTATNLLAALELLPPKPEKETPIPFTVDPDNPKALAYYSAKTIESTYPKVGADILASPAAGLPSLNQLITSHLHVTWQNLFASGIAVVKPLPHHTTHMISPAYELAKRLSHCPESPMPTSCPPNNRKCTPCSAATPLKISTPAHYLNTSTLYTIGTVPHPYTSTSLHSLLEHIDVSWVRRRSPRDAWVTDLTTDICPAGISGAPRVLRFKEAVASDYGASRSLWLLAERALPDDLDWYFGFAVPTEASWDATMTATPAAADDTAKSDGAEKPGAEQRPLPPAHDPKDGPVPTPEELKLEPNLLARARIVVGDAKTKNRASKEEIAVRDAIEAWNLADTEAWRFARAFLARKAMERKKWEEEEAKYAGGIGSEKGRRSGWDRWLDKRESAV
ncbi:hypothetical protein B0T22DRAFT_469076 [Podospora appendiculata]|uniref:Uncharacterized protein n=1 Tax=Podospora appendiculata TaxID=314037 RepID=A0AAE0X373_9PEZI|nr:hypothetical protein B0T22DRAFT_469076 [Podospora appendiculata]